MVLLEWSIPPLFQLYTYFLLKVQLTQLTLHALIICLVLCLESRRLKPTIITTTATITVATTITANPPTPFSSFFFKLGGRSQRF